MNSSGATGHFGRHVDDVHDEATGVEPGQRASKRLGARVGVEVEDAPTPFAAVDHALGLVRARLDTGGDDEIVVRQPAAVGQKRQVLLGDDPVDLTLQQGDADRLAGRVTATSGWSAAGSGDPGRSSLHKRLPALPRRPIEAHRGERDKLKREEITTTASKPRPGIKELTVSPQTIVRRRRRIAVGDLAAFFAGAIPAIAAELKRDGITPPGPPIAAYRQEQGNTFEVTVGFPVTRLPATDELVQMRLPGGKVVQATHVGTYRTLAETYGRLSEWFAGRRQGQPAPMWEEYLAGPDAEGEAGCLTRVVFPLS